MARRAGSITRKGTNKWLVRAYLGMEPQTGKRIYHSHVIHGTKKDAEKYINSVLREKDLGSFVEPANLTVNKYLDEWLDTAAKPKLSQRTHKDYVDLLARYVRPAFGHIKLSSLQPVHVQSLYNNMREIGLSARTIQYTHTVLASSLRQAVKWRYLSINPAVSADLPKSSRKPMRSLTVEQLNKFLRVAQEDSQGIIFVFAIITGTRPSEYLGLQWGNVDLDKGVIKIDRKLVDRSGIPAHFDHPKTARSKRSIPIPFELVQLLVDHKRKQNENRLKQGNKYVNQDLVFPALNGNPLRRENLIKRHFKPLLEKAELPKSIRLYDLRHTCATLLLSENTHPKIVSERLGHASVMLTLDIYSHVLPHMQQEASNKLGAIIFENKKVR